MYISLALGLLADAKQIQRLVEYRLYTPEPGHMCNQHAFMMMTYICYMSHLELNDGQVWDLGF